MKQGWMQVVAVALTAMLAVPAPVRAEKGGPIKINHTPVTWAVKGQSLTLKARVSGGVGGIDNVTLYYALFRDAAPFRVVMVSSGMDTYVGTIESGLLTGVEHVSYYIEAQDKEGTIEETPWYDVKFKNPEVAPATRGGTTPYGASTPAPANEEGTSALTIGLIAGGAAAVAAGAYFLSDSGSSDDGDGDGGGGGGGGDNTVTNAGNYAGNSTLCRSSAGGTQCETTSATFVIDSAGRIFSDTLSPGRSLTGTVSGNEFSLVADLTGSQEGLTGTAVYSGTVINGTRIIGTITGNYDQFGVPGTFSGTFSATRQ